MAAGFRDEDTKRNSIGVDEGIRPEKNSGNSGADFSSACVDMLERRSIADMSEYCTSSKMMAMRSGLSVGAMVI